MVFRRDSSHLRVTSSNYGKDGFRRFNKLKLKNPALKTLVAIGGWKEGSRKYSLMASNPESRERFADNAVAFVKKWGFDGFDLDWEYPNQRGGQPRDVQNFVELLDFINLMAYDFHGFWDHKTGHNAPLFAAPGDSEDQFYKIQEAAVNYWLSKGAPREKLILGVPTYGHSFTLANPERQNIGAVTSGYGNPGPYTQSEGILGYNEICEMHQYGGWNVSFDEERQVPWAYRGYQWISFDNVESIKAKAQFAKEKGLGGAMVWSVETDDFHGICGESYPLIKTLNVVLRS